ncbi:MAG: VirB8/TrbF family protein [Phenylobacterium sp.]|uniref:virB8 family protein n=1 Tax=Phenylobacterium sp. TaxID=1871053 RepID=UPI002730F350|nr:VirB8/TrbF family protein [Phenylobacterium sp.]MDP2011546.1 VirB8/TrbF family protein [Phenylobacterium sp.]
MTGAPGPDLKVYFGEAQSWDADRLRTAERSRRLAWIAAGAAGLVAIAAVGAVAALTPLKTVVPYVVRVDRNTGAVEVMTALTSYQPVTYDEAVTKHYLAQYVRAREGWLPPAAEANFRQVSIMSSPAEQQRWAQDFRPSNPQSPQIRLGADGEAQVEVRAISFISPGVANVRFHQSLRRGAQMESADAIATRAFTYSRAPMAEADRLLNPLGFQVTSYRSDPEVVR